MEQSFDFSSYNNIKRMSEDELIALWEKYLADKSNKQAKEWLLKLGFCFDNPKPNGLNVSEGFEFFYKVNNRKEL